jgi:hypothetical protein
MTFEEWWVQLHPAEVDELKPVFKDCWRLSQRNALLDAAKFFDYHEPNVDCDYAEDELRRMANELEKN